MTNYSDSICRDCLHDEPYCKCGGRPNYVRSTVPNKPTAPPPRPPKLRMRDSGCNKLSLAETILMNENKSLHKLIRRCELDNAERLCHVLERATREHFKLLRDIDPTVFDYIKGVINEIH